MKLLFVCTGNVCRSLMGERLARHLGAQRGLDVETRSCGIGAEGYFTVPPEIWRALTEAGIDQSPSHRPQLVSRELLAWADSVLVMTARQQDFLRDAYPEYRGKIALLREKAGLSGDVADPIGKPWADYQACRVIISEALERLLPATPAS